MMILGSLSWWAKMQDLTLAVYFLHKSLLSLSSSLPDFTIGVWILCFSTFLSGPGIRQRRHAYQICIWHQWGCVINMLDESFSIQKDVLKWNRQEIIYQKCVVLHQGVKNQLHKYKCTQLADNLCENAQVFSWSLLNKSKDFYVAIMKRNIFF